MVTLLALFLLFTTPFVENNVNVLNKKEKALSLLIVFGIFVIIVVGFYITWTIVGAEYITGVQGRYFLPIGIILLLSCCLKNNYIKGVKKYYYITIVLINIVAITNIIKYFMT